MKTPRARGPLSHWTRRLLVDGHRAPLPTVETRDALRDADLQISLWMLYELHYRGFSDADPDLAWDVDAIAVRQRLEAPFETAVRELAHPFLSENASASDDLAAEILHLCDVAPGPSVATYVHRKADLEEFLDFMRLRSVYHLKESDPQSFLLPRLRGKAKVALAELQYDEYGGGLPERLHQQLFAEALEGCELDSSYGAYVDTADALTLATNNVMSLFALTPRLTGASAGHLAAFEATSSLPCRRVAGGIRRLGLPESVAAYYDEHVEADAVHEQVAMRDICGALVANAPHLRDDVLLGVAACLCLDAVAGEALLTRWESGEHLGSGAA